MSSFRITGPAIISFSGGRTSAYMLHRILEAHGGKLPGDVHVVFANTGREMEGTLRFVYECGARWGVPITWVEFRARRKDGYEVVGLNSASRGGEPFAALLAAASALPNPVQRSCTQELKIRTMKRWVVGELGWKRWVNIVGLRADEQRRLVRLAKPTKERFTRVAPLAEAGITKEHVGMFWACAPFDLELRGPHEGNCDGCFLKSRAALVHMCRTYPARMAWWAEQEAVPRGTAGVSRQFRSSKSRQPYSEMLAEAENMPPDRAAKLAKLLGIEDAEDCADGECVV